MYFFNDHNWNLVLYEKRLYLFQMAGRSVVDIKQIMKIWALTLSLTMTFGKSQHLWASFALSTNGQMSYSVEKGMFVGFS